MKDRDTHFISFGIVREFELSKAVPTCIFDPFSSKCNEFKAWACSFLESSTRHFTSESIDLWLDFSTRKIVSFGVMEKWKTMYYPTDLCNIQESSAKRVRHHFS